MKNILVVFTGGTFSMKIDKETGGAVPHYNGEELLEKIPEAAKLANISQFEFGKYPGPHMTPTLMLELALIVKEFAQSNKYDGIIITHGTDTLEETSYLVDLIVKTDIPIVFIGAMKTSSDYDWDGPRNMLDAIHIINNRNSIGLGVLVCLSGEVNAASEVTKTHTEDVETFHSLDFGALGFVDRGRVLFNRTPRKLECVNVVSLNSNVDLIKTFAGMNDKFFRFSADSGVDAIVVEAMGVGNVPPLAFDGIKYARDKGVIILLVSRCPSGETLDTYSYTGAGLWLKKENVIFTDYLNGQKARIKLMLCLSKTTNIDELGGMF